VDLIAGLTIGLHLVSVHVPGAGLQDINPGIYVYDRAGFTAGVFRNSVDRTSVYAGWSYDVTPFKFTVGAITGYQRRRICTQVMTASGPVADCAPYGGGTTHPISPFVSPSVALPSVLGIVPRISVMPAWLGGSTAFHLSVEKSW
jgi:hypothetical protein